MEIGIYIDSIFEHKCLTCLVIALRLDPLYFTQKLPKELSQAFKVIDNKIGLSVTHLFFNNIFSLAMFEHPLRDEFAILHMSLCVGFAKFHSCKLGKDTIANIVHILCLVSFGVIKNAEFYKFGISNVI